MGHGERISGQRHARRGSRRIFVRAIDHRAGAAVGRLYRDLMGAYRMIAARMRKSVALDRVWIVSSIITNGAPAIYRHKVLAEDRDN